MKKLIAAASTALVLVTLTSCAGGPAGDGRDCLDVPAGTAEHVASGVNDFTIDPGEIAAVRSEAMADANIVAMSFTTPDGEEETGVWAIGGSLDEPGATLSVDAVAATVTDWPNEVNGQELDITEDGAQEALDCLAQ